MPYSAKVQRATLTLSFFFFFFSPFFFPFGSFAGQSIQSLFDRMYQEEEMSGSNQYACPTCQSLQDAVQRVGCIFAINVGREL